VAIRLYLLRHAVAERGTGVPDLERELTPAGLDSTERAAATLVQRGLRFDGGLTSPARRAERTAEIYWRHLGNGELQASAALAPGAEPEEVLAAVIDAARAEAALARWLLVGHMPDLAELVSFLAPGRGVSFAPGGLARVDFAGKPRRARGKLIWIYRPERLLEVTEI